jgi:hypothetical protein
MGSKVAEVALKALAGGLFVLAFAAVTQELATRQYGPFPDRRSPASHEHRQPSA